MKGEIVSIEFQVTVYGNKKTKWVWMNAVWLLSKYFYSLVVFWNYTECSWWKIKDD